MVEKGSEVGAHILSGAVIDPIGLDRLLPDWRDDPDRAAGDADDEGPLPLLGPSGGDHGCRIRHAAPDEQPRQFRRLARRTSRWLGAQAEALGVEIYPGLRRDRGPASAQDGAVVGVATGDMGIGQRRPAEGRLYQRGMELRGKYVLLRRRRARLADQAAVARYGLDEGREPQKFGIGIKELWQVEPARFQPGLVQHSFGWPLGRAPAAARFLYHFGENLVAVGFVVHLNYTQPDALAVRRVPALQDPSADRAHFDGGKRLAYGARAITEGGWQSVPKLAFPGGALIGCAAGFVNVPRIKGVAQRHPVGHAGRRASFAALGDGRAHDELTLTRSAWRASDIGRDLLQGAQRQAAMVELRHLLGVALGGIDMWTNELFGLLALRHAEARQADYATLKPLAEVKPIVYPKPDGRSPSTSCRRCSCPTPITRRTSRSTCG